MLAKYPVFPSWEKFVGVRDWSLRKQVSGVRCQEEKTRTLKPEH